MIQNQKIIFIFYVICFFQLVFKGSLIAQTPFRKSSLICHYQLVYQPDSTDKTIRKEKFTLTVSNNLSTFQSPNSRSRDSLFSAMMGFIKEPTVMATYSKQLMQLSATQFRYLIYKNELNSRITYFDWIGSNFYRYEETTPLFKWTIFSTTSLIAGYTCQRAITSFAGRTFEAWFTREIPINDGPYKFCGLPGLIIKVGDTRSHYVFELVSLTQSPSVLPLPFPSGTAALTTKTELRRGQLAYQASLAGSSISFGNITARPISPENREAIIRGNKKRNNNIELK